MTKARISLVFRGRLPALGILGVFAAGSLWGQWAACAGSGQCITSGDVGIGTSSFSSNPSGSPVTLDLGGSYSFTAGANPKLKLYDPGPGNAAWVYGLGVSSNEMDFIVPPGAGFEFFQNGSTAAGVTFTSGGKVGIGTATPGATMALNGPTGSPATSGTSQNGVLQVGGASGGNGLDVGVLTGQPYTTWMQSGFLYNYSYGAYYPISLNPLGGNVGIGTTNPGYTLSVNGTIQAKEVLVNTGWSDYVFAPDYRLAPLSEVADYIQANGHLPEIPSARQVEEKGVSVGEMESKLLAKVEELTLHMIEAEKENKALRERIERLEKGGDEHSAGGDQGRAAAKH